MSQLSIEDTAESQIFQSNFSDRMFTDSNSVAILTNNASALSLPSMDKPECSNCLSVLNDDNLGCPYCTQVFCRVCIEDNYANDTRDQCCPKCCQPVAITEYRTSTIIGKFGREGISALKCVKCGLIPKSHRLCFDSNCSALFCYNCYKQANALESSPIVQDLNLPKNIKCPQCQMADTYVNGAVSYYTTRIVEYQVAQDIESYSDVLLPDQSLPNTVWKQEEFLPKEGTLEENYNRMISVICFNGPHIQFSDGNKARPLLIISEPFEYACPESLQLSYWNTENEINRWENEKNVQFFQYNLSSIAVYIPHFSKVTVRNSRFREHFMIDEAFLNLVYDYDFTNVNDGEKTFKRGPETYKRPCGWYRKAIRVIGKFKDEKWLGEGVNAWPVAYHGTSANNIKSILSNGLRVGGSNGIPLANGCAYGQGIYLSPNPKFSGQAKYSKPVHADGHEYQIMFQVRVKSESINKTKNVDIWTCSNSQDIRPYGICFRETRFVVRYCIYRIILFLSHYR